ncbi:MAG: hypothetical protein M0Z56_00230, partial [Desulfobacteraceae bacterium]|nr:hypothetical protein [Desulfobacteraceae bacterium]
TKSAGPFALDYGKASININGHNASVCTPGHRGRAAESLGIHRRTLFKKMKKLGIDHAFIENDRSQ